MKLDNFKKFNICLSILIIIDLILITFTLISKVPINIYYMIIIFDTIVCIVLLKDFFTRLFQSNNKKRFILKNWLEIIAAIPFDLIMMPFALNAYNMGLLKVLRFIKIMALFSQFLETIDVFLKKTHLDEIFGVTLLVVLASTLGLYLFDSSINSLFDSLWFVLSTITTVGYGDVMPQTAIGKTIGLITLIIGVLLFSAVTGAMATYFAGRLFANPDFNITKNDDNIEILKEDLSFNKGNLNSVHKKVDMIDKDVKQLKNELEEMKELNKELREEIRALNDNLKK